ncbi:MAG: crotonase [Myxococcales bacterium]|nr:MAG: crotonase [Myxococcales bacterium]
MAYENILFEKKGEIAVITVNRPKALNALNLATLSEMRDAIKIVEADKALRVLIVTGAEDKPAEGKKPMPRAFVAGADIVLMSTIPAADKKTPRDFVELGQEVMRRLEKLPIPVIAAVDGFALGGGTELALACDIIYASDRAKFGQPEVKLGLIPGFGGTQRLPRLVGRNLAKELIYTGDIIDVQRAREIGLVNAVFPPEALMENVMGLAQRIIACAPLAVVDSKRAINEGYHKELDEGSRIEVDCFMNSFTTEDRVEGTKAFVEKRKPSFRGK